MMSTGNLICLNGEIIAGDKPVLAADNRSFRYGDGLFETMKMIRGSIVLKEMHFERLFNSLEFLRYSNPSFFTKSFLEKSIQDLAAKNNCIELCRIRLTVFRGNGNLYPSSTAQSGYLIECTALNSSVNDLNEDGFSIGIYKTAHKTCDTIANIKSANFLPYALAALFAEENKWNDALVLNVNGSIADATIASLFIVKDGIVYTPALTEGCINGVMRRYLLEQFAKVNIAFSESVVLEQDLLQADEIFLTNAINGIRWVKNCAGKEYRCSVTRKIYNDFIKTIFS